MNNLRNPALLSAAAVLVLCACNQTSHGSAAAGIAQTKFPGQITAGGGTSGEVQARNNKPKSDGSTTGGTPFHAGGAGGNTGGTATAGTVQESGNGPSGSSTPTVAAPVATPGQPAGPAAPVAK